MISIWYKTAYSYIYENTTDRAFLESSFSYKDQKNVNSLLPFIKLFNVSELIKQQ